MTTTNITTMPRTTGEHAHRWRIDEPNGQFSTGVCRLCGAEKLFRNWLEDADFVTDTERRLAA